MTTFQSLCSSARIGVPNEQRIGTLHGLFAFAKEVGCVLIHLGRILLGVTLLLLGLALTFTLWLLPIGLPLALLGLAILGG